MSFQLSEGTRPMSRGWTSEGLPTVGDDPSLWTIGDASRLLGPPQLSAAQVRELVKLFDLKYDLRPQGKRRVTARGRGGRHARVYKADSLIRAYDDLVGSGSERTEAGPEGPASVCD